MGYQPARPDRNLSTDRTHHLGPVETAVPGCAGPVPFDSTVPDDREPDIHPLTANDYQGTMRPGHIAAGLSGNGLALEIAEFEFKFECDLPLALPRFLPLTELLALRAEKQQ
jgi:hypothetical protein